MSVFIFLRYLVMVTVEILIAQNSRSEKKLSLASRYCCTNFYAGFNYRFFTEVE